MVGRDLVTAKMVSHLQSAVLLSVNNLCARRFSDISFQLHHGEILGLAGLVGAGRTEIVRAIFGADDFVSGEVILKNEKLHISHPFQSILKGMAFVPEERKSLGLFAEMSIQDNIISGQLRNALVGRWYSHDRVKQLALTSKNKLNIITPGVQQKVNDLSGGNQQKVLLAKWLLTNPDVLIIDEPTVGIDVGAKFEIYEIVKSLAAAGKGIIIVSSDLPELLGICDKIIIIKKGLLAGELLHTEATEEKVMALASN